MASATYQISQFGSLGGTILKIRNEIILNEIQRIDFYDPFIVSDYKRAWAEDWKSIMNEFLTNPRIFDVTGSYDIIQRYNLSYKDFIRLLESVASKWSVFHYRSFCNTLRNCYIELKKEILESPQRIEYFKEALEDDYYWVYFPTVIQQSVLNLLTKPCDCTYDYIGEPENFQIKGWDDNLEDELTHVLNYFWSDNMQVNFEKYGIQSVRSPYETIVTTVKIAIEVAIRHDIYNKTHLSEKERDELTRFAEELSKKGDKDLASNILEIVSDLSTIEIEYENLRSDWCIYGKRVDEHPIVKVWRQGKEATLKYLNEDFFTKDQRQQINHIIEESLPFDNRRWAAEKVNFMIRCKQSVLSEMLKNNEIGKYLVDFQKSCQKYYKQLLSRCENSLKKEGKDLATYMPSVETDLVRRIIQKRVCE